MELENRTLPKAQRTQGIENFDSFKAEGLTSFGILIKLKLTFFGKGQKVQRTLTNPFYNLEISIWVKILNQILNLMSYLKKSQYRSKKISVSVLKKLVSKKISKFGLEKSLSIGLENIWSRKKVSVSVSKTLVSKKVSVSVSKIFVSKKVSVTT